MSLVSLILTAVCGTPSETFLKGRPTTVYSMFNPLSNANWNHGNMYPSSHLRTRLATSFREAQYPRLLLLLLLIPVPSLSSMSFLRLLQNMSPSISPSLTRYVCSLAYAESLSLCTALHSSTSTDYPNSHKLILVIADCMAKGAEIH